LAGGAASHFAFLDFFICPQRRRSGALPSVACTCWLACLRFLYHFQKTRNLFSPVDGHAELITFWSLAKWTPSLKSSQLEPTQKLLLFFSAVGNKSYLLTLLVLHAALRRVAFCIVLTPTTVPPKKGRQLSTYFTIRRHSAPGTASFPHAWIRWISRIRTAASSKCMS